MIIIEIFEEEPQLGCGGLIVLFLLIFGISKCSSCSSTYDNKSIDGIKVESPSYTQTPSSSNSNYSASGVDISQILSGKWSGTINQRGYGNYTMTAYCDWANNSFSVEYPTLGCGGYLILQSYDKGRAVFIEQSTYGYCTNGDKIIFEKKTDNSIRVSVYLSSSNFSSVACSGKIFK